MLCPPAFPTQLNGTNVNLPVTPAPGVSVFKSGKHYTVSMNFGVTVRYDGNHFMDIKVTKEWVKTEHRDVALN